jgi:hypothetical protein
MHHRFKEETMIDIAALQMLPESDSDSSDQPGVVCVPETIRTGEFTDYGCDTAVCSIIGC